MPIAGAGAGASMGAKMGADIAATYASDANARAESAQATLDNARMEQMMMMDMEMEQQSREQAQRMSALAGVSAHTPQNNYIRLQVGRILKRVRHIWKIREC